jgi:hypothetical protein
MFKGVLKNGSEPLTLNLFCIMRGSIQFFFTVEELLFLLVWKISYIYSIWNDGLRHNSVFNLSRLRTAQGIYNDWRF